MDTLGVHHLLVHAGGYDPLIMVCFFSKLENQLKTMALTIYNLISGYCFSLIGKQMVQDFPTVWTKQDL